MGALWHDALWHAALWHAALCRRLHLIGGSGGMRASWHSEALLALASSQLALALASSQPASLWHGVRTSMLAVQCHVATAGGWEIRSCGSSFACWTTRTRSVLACNCIPLGTLQRRATVERYSSQRCHQPLAVGAPPIEPHPIACCCRHPSPHRWRSACPRTAASRCSTATTLIPKPLVSRIWPQCFACYIAAVPSEGRGTFRRMHSSPSRCLATPDFTSQLASLLCAAERAQRNGIQHLRLVHVKGDPRRQAPWYSHSLLSKGCFQRIGTPAASCTQLMHGQEGGVWSRISGASSVRPRTAWVQHSSQGPTAAATK